MTSSQKNLKKLKKPIDKHKTEVYNFIRKGKGVFENFLKDTCHFYFFMTNFKNKIIRAKASSYVILQGEGAFTFLEKEN